MTWTLETFEVRAGSGTWYWSATYPASQDAARAGGPSRSWVSAASFNSEAVARASGENSLRHIKLPRGVEACSRPEGTEPIAVNIDAYSLDHIDGELVMITPSLLVARANSRWGGNAIVGRDYLLSLLACAIERGVFHETDLSFSRGLRSA
jgi:hypothetical protein